MLEITETNLPMLLRFEDKNSMHFAIETRLPFLDYRFVEFALGLPSRVKLNRGWTKWPLRAAMQKDLPAKISVGERTRSALPRPTRYGSTGMRLLCTKR